MCSVRKAARQMSGAVVFFVLDAKTSSWQIKLDLKSSLLTTFSTLFVSLQFLLCPLA